MKRQKYINILCDGVVSLYKYVVTGFFWSVLFFLAFYCIVSTCFISCNIYEYTFFVKDSVARNLFSLAAAAVFSVIIRWAAGLGRISQLVRRINEEEAFYRKCRNILLWIILSLALIWIASTQYDAGADQSIVQEAAYYLNIRGEAAFMPGEYLDGYQNQIGLVYLSWLFSIVFGGCNYLAFQLINALGLIWFYRELTEVCGIFKFKNTVRLAVLCAGILFFPLIMYTSFVYGTILGLACSVSAVKNELLCLERRSVWRGLAAVLFITLAVILKNNYMIFMVAMVIYGIVEMFRQRQWKLLLLPAMIIASFIIQSSMILGLARHMSGAPLDQGINPLAWIVMGLEINDYNVPGWNSGFNADTYIACNGRTDVQVQLAKERIRNAVNGFKEDKESGICFFTQKTASQWCNPNFQSFWIIQVRTARPRLSNWVWKFTSEKGMDSASRFLDLLEFNVLAGAMLYCLFHWKKEKYIQSLILPMTMVGGFVFHMFWEAKAQYTIAYFALLLPYAASGFSCLADGLVACLNAGGPAKARAFAKKNISVLAGFAVLSAVLSVILLGLYSGGRIGCLAEDTEAYETYLREHDTLYPLEAGIYHLKSGSGFKLACYAEDERKKDVRLTDEADSGTEDIRIFNLQEYTWLKFANRFYLSRDETTDPEHQGIFAGEADMEEYQKWRIRRLENGAYCILRPDGYALTCDPEYRTVHVAPFDGNDNQLWYPEKKD